MSLHQASRKWLMSCKSSSKLELGEVQPSPVLGVLKSVDAAAGRRQLPWRKAAKSGLNTKKSLWFAKWNRVLWGTGRKTCARTWRLNMADRFGIFVDCSFKWVKHASPRWHRLICAVIQTTALEMGLKLGQAPVVVKSFHAFWYAG